MGNSPFISEMKFPLEIHLDHYDRIWDLASDTELIKIIEMHRSALEQWSNVNLGVSLAYHHGRCMCSAALILLERYPDLSGFQVEQLVRAINILRDND